MIRRSLPERKSAGGSFYFQIAPLLVRKSESRTFSIREVTQAARRDAQTSMTGLTRNMRCQHVTSCQTNGSKPQTSGGSLKPNKLPTIPSHLTGRGVATYDYLRSVCALSRQRLGFSLFCPEQQHRPA